MNLSIQDAASYARACGVDKARDQLIVSVIRQVQYRQHGRGVLRDEVMASREFNRLYVDSRSLDCWIERVLREQSADDAEWYSLTEACQLAYASGIKGLNAQLRRAVLEGEITAERIGRSWRIERGYVDAWIAQQQQVEYDRILRQQRETQQRWIWSCCLWGIVILLGGKKR
jgi:excisionase family DNA binding protein